jgi:hypothetical protein
VFLPSIAEGARRLRLEHDLPEGFAVLDQAMSLGCLLEGQLTIDHGAMQRALAHEFDQLIGLRA